MYSEAQKRANYKWNEKNPEKHKEIQKRATKKYYEKNKDDFNERAKAYYYAHKEEILKKKKEQRESKKNKEKIMEKELKEFLDELEFNSIINKQKGIENRIDMNYIIERIKDILKGENKNDSKNI